MEAETIAVTASAIVNLLVIFTVTGKWARWTGVVDARLNELTKSIQYLKDKERTEKNK